MKQPLASGIAGAGVGSIAGGLIGTLIGWGVDEDRADRRLLDTEWNKYRATEEVYPAQLYSTSRAQATGCR